jgi:branched-chain amino acid transport system permease protein
VLRQILLNGAIESTLTALIALGFAIIYTTTRVFHVAHGAVYALGAYGCVFFLSWCGFGLVPSAVLGVVFSAAFGALIELLVYAPLARRQSPSLVGLLSSLGVYIVLVNLIALAFGTQNQTLKPGQARTLLIGGGLIMTDLQVLQVLVCVCAVGLVMCVLAFTSFGVKIRAIRENAALARVTGTDVYVIRILALALGSGLAGLSSVLSAIDVGTDPHVGMSALLVGAVAMIIGGTRTFVGPLVGAVGVSIIRSFAVWTFSARWADVVTFILLITVLVYRPEGLVAMRRRMEEAVE